MTTPYETELARRVELNTLLLTQLSRIVVNVTERAIALGAFPEGAVLLSSDCEQLSAFIHDQEKEQAALLALFNP